jgi:hypothetical protein
MGMPEMRSRRAAQTRLPNIGKMEVTCALAGDPSAAIQASADTADKARLINLYWE